VGDAYTVLGLRVLDARLHDAVFYTVALSFWDDHALKGVASPATDAAAFRLRSGLLPAFALTPTTL
jgi:hypothetical protein